MESQSVIGSLEMYMNPYQWVVGAFIGFGVAVLVLSVGLLLLSSVSRKDKWKIIAVVSGVGGLLFLGASAFIHSMGEDIVQSERIADVNSRISEIGFQVRSDGYIPSVLYRGSTGVEYAIAAETIPDKNPAQCLVSTILTPTDTLPGSYMFLCSPT